MPLAKNDSSTHKQEVMGFIVGSVQTQFGEERSAFFPFLSHFQK